MVKYPHWVQKLLYYTTQHEDGRHIDMTNVYRRGRLRLPVTTARRLSAYMSSRALATTTTSSYYCYYNHHHHHNARNMSHGQ